MGSPPLFERMHEPEPAEVRLDQRHTIASGRGESIAMALMAAGQPALTRSVKYRRLRGPYCLSGDCGSCLARVDGEPNIRTCLHSITGPTDVESQNVVGSLGLDPSAVVDRVFRRFEHHHFLVKPRFVNRLMQDFARRLTGLGDLPEHVADGTAEVRSHRPTVLVVGAGPAGQAALSTLRGRGIDAVAVDRLDPPLLGLDSGPPAGLLPRTGLFAAYPEEALWMAAQEIPGHPSILHGFRPAHVLLATGTREPMIPLVNNDLPGVVAARGLLRQLRAHHMTLAVPAAVVGTGAVAEHAAAQLGCPRFAPDQVQRIRGGDRVEALELRDGTHRCELVALAPAPAPAHELAAQAGARLRFDGAGFAVARDGQGRCQTDGAFDVWACGDVTGHVGPEAAARDGRRVAEALADHIQPNTARSGARP